MTAARPRVLVTRPAAEAAALAAALEAGGYAPISAPMLEMRRAAAVDPAELAGAAAVLLASPRAARAVAEDLGAAPAGAMACCVGAATAAAAREAGFDRILSAEADGAALIERVAESVTPPGPLLWLRGRDTAVDLSAALRSRGFAVSVRIVYAAEMRLDLPDTARVALADGGPTTVLLFSERTAQAFLAAAASTDLSGCVALCLSERVAATARGGRFRSVEAAETPHIRAVLRRLDAILGGHAGGAERVC